MSKKTYIKLKTEISNLKWKTLEKIIKSYLNKNKKIFCKWINKRPVFINDFLNITLKRNDWNNRMRAFTPSIELIKKSKIITNIQKNWNNLFSYEFKWKTPKWYLVWVHIKEIKVWKNKILKLISIFWDNKKI